jgi:hypothetical protein
LLLGTAVTLGAALQAPVQAEELRVGFIAPMTGGFAQVGKDMVDGFQMYLDEVNGDFAGAKMKLIVEDDQAKPDLGVTKAKKLILSDKVQMIVGGVLASTGYALAPVSTQEKTVYLASVPASDDLTQRDATPASIPISSAPAGRRRNPTTRSAHGPATRATRRSSPSPPITPSVTRPPAASRRPSRIAAARSSRKSGRRSATRISDPTSQPSSPTPTRCSR